MLRVLVFRCVPCLSRQAKNFSQAQMLTPGIASPFIGENQKTLPKPDVKIKGKIVSAAFEKLKTLHAVEVNDSIIKMIVEAKNIDELLSIVTIKKLTRNHSLKLVSVLADWTLEGKIKTSEFEKDPRFAVVCRTLGSSPAQEVEATGKSAQYNTNTDLGTVLGVTSDDEAAKLISNISLDQMVKVLSTLATKKRRSTPLLRSLAYNIASSSQKLDIKQGADSLYAVASLNFHNEMLVDKICHDICNCLMSNTRRAVVGSVITSLGLLRYKHIELLDMLSEWVEKHVDVCGPQDFISLIMTLAVVHHTPTNQDTIFPMVLERLQVSGVPNPQDWLDLVWALTILTKETPDQVASVLSSDFTDSIKTINAGELTVSTKLKLLNINGVAQMRLKDYKGPLLNVTAEEWKVPLLRSKEKQALVTAVQETMLNLLPSAVYLGTNIETDMGFIIDAECLINSKMTPLPLFDKKTKAPIDRSGPDTQRGIKVAILVWDYHDMTRGRREVTGVNVLCQELVRLKGYRVITVDFVDFNPRSILVDRVKHLNEQLRSAIGPN